MNKKDYLTPLKTIRKYCINICCEGNFKEPRQCDIDTCPLFPYRLGKHPFIKRNVEGRKRKDGIFVPTDKVRNVKLEQSMSISERKKVIHDYLEELLKGIE